MGPTKIYRFLGERHLSKPIFLLRNLYYMKDRMSRTNEKRKYFKIDTLLNSRMEKITLEHSNLPGLYLNIIFAGYVDRTKEFGSAEIRTYINKNNIPYTQLNKFDKQSLLGISKVSKHIDQTSKFSLLTIPYKYFYSESNPSAKMCKLVFCMQSADQSCSNEDILTRKTSKMYCSEIELTTITSEEGEYNAPMYLHHGSSLNESDYNIRWEAFTNDQRNIFDNNLFLKFYVKWSNTILPNPISRHDFFHLTNFDDLISVNTKKTFGNMSIIDKNRREYVCNSKDALNGENIKCISYTFMYSNNTRQQTEETNELVCPFCVLDCKTLYILIKHLKLSHDRFNFTFTPSGDSANIDISLNDSYDGTYTGSPHDVLTICGTIFPRKFGPVRRTTVTKLLVCKPPKRKPCLSEFLEHDEDEINNQRSYIVGHNRLYHHTETCLPVHPKEIDIDSEGENDPVWLQQKTIQMIDDFTDVNEGEKELIKMWNLHVMKNGYVGDCQLPIACDMFINAKGKEIIEKNLYRNFILHLCSLFDYGLISPDIIYKCIQKLKNILSNYNYGQQILSKRRAEQLKYWLNFGKEKLDTLKLKSSASRYQTSPKNKLNSENCTSKLTVDSRVSSSISPPTEYIDRISKRRVSVLHDKDDVKRRKTPSTSIMQPTMTRDQPNRLMTRRQSMACLFSSKSKS
ncbi:SUZ12 family protein [Megaselia abdita]